MWQRRTFLKAAGAGFVASLMPMQAEALERGELVFASTIQKSTGNFAAILLTERGDVISSVDLPDRGHDITFSPVTGKAVVFARRPGTFALVFDPAGNEAPVTVTSVEGRHFYGHGAFSADGKLLFATENDFEAARGVIGIYDASADYRRVGEYDTHGIGPHEMLMIPDGHTLVIANGGTETHPDYGRAELNLDSMDPSLVFVDSRNGDLVGQLRLDADLHQLSIRHMAIDKRNRVWFGCQFRGTDGRLPQLVGYASMDGEIRLIELPPDVLADLKNYVGAVAASSDGETIGITAPQGNTLIAIDATQARVTAFDTLRSVCGMAPDGPGFVASGGFGEWQGIAGSPVAKNKFEFGFDNHLRPAIQKL